MNPTDLIRPNRFTYVSPHVPKAAVSKPQEVQVAPNLPSPTQMAQNLVQQGGQLIQQQAGATREGIMAGVDGRRALSPILSTEARDASQIRIHETGRNLENWTNQSLRAGDQAFQQNLTVADRYAQLAGNTTSGVAAAIAGEQAIDGRRLDIIDRITRPRFVDDLGSIVSAIAPIAALFAA